MSSAKSGSAASTKKATYVYYDQLLFLDKVKASKPTSSKFSDKNSSPNTGSSLTNNEPPQKEDGSGSGTNTGGEQRNGTRGKPKKQKRSKVQSDSQEDGILQVLKYSIKAREERVKNQDSDDARLFLLSLLNSLKKVPEPRKLQVRAEPMQVFISHSSQSANYHPSYQLFPYDQADASLGLQQLEHSSTSGGIFRFNCQRED